MALLICSCATVSGPDRYQPVATTDLSALKTCEKILAPVQLPEVTAGMRADVAFLRDEAALLDARDKVDAGRGCVVSVRNKFTGPVKLKKKRKAK